MVQPARLQLGSTRGRTNCHRFKMQQQHRIGLIFYSNLSGKEGHGIDLICYNQDCAERRRKSNGRHICHNQNRADRRRENRNSRIRYYQGRTGRRRDRR